MYYDIFKLTTLKAFPALSLAFRITGSSTDIEKLFFFIFEMIQEMLIFVEILQSMVFGNDSLGNEPKKENEHFICMLIWTISLLIKGKLISFRIFNYTFDWLGDDI